MSKTALFVACLALVLVTGQGKDSAFVVRNSNFLAGTPLKKMMLKKKMMMGALLHHKPSHVPVTPPPTPIPEPPSPPMSPEPPVPSPVYPKITGEMTVNPKITGETMVQSKVTGEMMDDGDMMMHADSTSTHAVHTEGASMVHIASSLMESTISNDEHVNMA